MKLKIYIAIILFLFSISFSQLQVFSLVYPQIIVPGASGYIQLSFKSLFSTKAKLLNVFSDAPIKLLGNYTDIDLGNILPNSTINYYIKFNVDKNAKPGNYLIYFVIQECNIACNEFVVSSLLQIKSTQKIEIISIEPNKIYSGEKVNLTIKIQNKEDYSIENVVVTLNSTLLLPFGKSNIFFINSINSKSIYELKVPITTLSNVFGTAPLIINLQYLDSSGTIQYLSFVSSIEIIPKIDFDVILTEVSSNSLTLQVINTGYFQANSVILKIENASIFPNSYSLGNLLPGDYSSVTIELPKNLNISTLKIKIDFTDTLGYRKSIEKELFLPSFGKTIEEETKGESYQSRINNSFFSISYIVLGILGIILIILIFRSILKKGKK
ncbi:MAG: hypothetical protein QXQ14_01505 [Candidatus Aenigmatarchaeota archaeon]